MFSFSNESILGLCIYDCWAIWFGFFCVNYVDKYEWIRAKNKVQSKSSNDTGGEWLGEDWAEEKGAYDLGRLGPGPERIYPPA